MRDCLSLANVDRCRPLCVATRLIQSFSSASVVSGSLKIAESASNIKSLLSACLQPLFKAGACVELVSPFCSSGVIRSLTPAFRRSIWCYRAARSIWNGVDVIVQLS